MAKTHRITAIVPTQRDSQRATVKVEGQAVATLSQKRIAQLGLDIGLPWDDALAEQVEAAAAFDKAMMHAMNGLSRRAMSEVEVKQKLKQKGHPESIVAQVTDRLHELELLDDEAFGRSLIRDLQNRQPAGPRLMKQKLAQKGLDGVLIDQLVDEALQATDPVEDALAVARKRLPRLQGLNAATRKRRLYGQLARRGFTPETLDQVMNQLADELRDDADEQWD
jgi:regulatory protein